MLKRSNHLISQKTGTILATRLKVSFEGPYFERSSLSLSAAKIEYNVGLRWVLWVYMRYRLRRGLKVTKRGGTKKFMRLYLLNYEE